jgi:hypothetical protein
MNSEIRGAKTMRAQQIAFGMGLLVTAACAGNQVSTDFSPAVNFSQFRSYALVMPPDTAARQLLDQRIRNAVEAQLASKGLVLRDRQHADLFVGYGMVDKTHTEIYDSQGGWGWGAGWGWRYYRWGVAWPMTVQRQVEMYTNGTVVVNMVDARTKQVVWQGEVADVVTLPVDDPLRATRQIDAAVAKLFAKYPPPSSGAQQTQTADR